MIRRALCLLLTGQLLLVQGMLCRACPSSGAQWHAADRPHIHTRTLTPGPASPTPARKRCPCCLRRAGRGAPPAASVSSHFGAGDAYDAVYLPVSLVAEGRQRDQSRPMDLLTAQAFFVTGPYLCDPLGLGPEPPVAPSPRHAPRAPLFLLTQALLI